MENEQDYPRELIIRNPLWAFMMHCEIYCTAACCGIDAFEIHPSLLLRKVIDENLAGRDGNQLFWLAWKQLREITVFVDTIKLKSINEQVPFWNEEETRLPQYWLPESKIREWLIQWDDVFEKASRHIGPEIE
jgi:hypothetical protein